MALFPWLCWLQHTSLSCAVSSAICNGLFGRTSTALASSVTCVLHSNPDFTSAVSHNDLSGPPTYPLIGLRDLLAICSLASVPLWHGKGTLHASKDSTTRATLPIQKDPIPREWYHERHVYLVPFCEQKAPLAPLFQFQLWDVLTWGQLPFIPVQRRLLLNGANVINNHSISSSRGLGSDIKFLSVLFIFNLSFLVLFLPHLSLFRVDTWINIISNNTADWASCSLKISFPKLLHYF